MGLYVNITADIPARGLLRKRPGRDAVFQSVTDAIHAAVTDPLLKRFLRFNQYEHTLNVELLPGAEPLGFDWDPNGRITASGKTSTLGPGYHAYLVDVLLTVGASTGLKWNWADGDDANYALLRDFYGLQGEMATFMKAIAGIVTSPEHQDTVNLMINWPINATSPVDGGFVVTPLGPLTRQWCEAMAVAGDAELRREAPKFFAWWNQDADASFWRAMGLQFLWSEVHWHASACEQEDTLYHLVLDCFERARELDPELPLPTKEIGELRQLLEADPQTEPPPSRNGIGFFRGPMHFRPNGWTLTLDGYFHEDTSEEGRITYWHDERAVRFSSYTVERAGARTPATELIASVAEKGDGEPVVRVKDAKRLIQGWRSVDESGSQLCTHLTGGVATDGRLAILTITYSNSAHAAWAEGVLKSVHPRSGDGQA